MSAPVLEVRDLKTHFFTRGGLVKAVDGVDLSVARGKALGLVGESGSGKSVTGFSLMGLIDPPGRIVAGSIKLAGQELVGIDAEAMRRVRGRRIAMIFQDPMMTLNPVLKIGTQIAMALRAHESLSTSEARRRAADALGLVGIPSPEERLDAYPHQFSGGMRQRVAIAIAMLHRPELIIADEPTTALDVSIQAQIIAEIRRLVDETGTALIWISHDLAVVAGLADDICVMYAGRMVERGPVDAVLDDALHPYTRGLLDSVPERTQRGERLRQIPGSTPSLLNPPSGCAFRPRCPRARDACADAPPLAAHRPDHAARCFFPHTGVVVADASDSPAEESA